MNECDEHLDLYMHAIYLLYGQPVFDYDVATVSK